MSPTTTDSTSPPNAARPRAVRNIWVGKHIRPGEKPPKVWELSASLATVLTLILSVIVLLATIGLGTSNRLALLDEHDRQAQEKWKSFDALVIQSAEVRNDVKWMRENMEKRNESTRNAK